MNLTSQLAAGPYAEESPYWNGLAASELRLPRCAACAAWNWPPVPRCPSCGSWEHDWPLVEPSGTVYSWTRVRRASTPDRAALVPYVVVLVEIAPAGDVRIMGQLDGPDDGLAIGQPVRGTFHPPTAQSRGMPTIRWTLAGAEATT